MRIPCVWSICLSALICVLAPAAGVRAADVKIDSSVRYQTIDGFGTCTYIYSKALEATTTRKFQDLYMGDLGASLIRMQISPDCQPEPDLDLDHLNLDKLHMDVRSVKLLGEAFGAMQKLYPGKLKVFASLWSPPGWMKDSGGIAGGGHLRADRREYLGKYIAALCIDFEKIYGVHIYAVSLQNELAFKEWYQSCVYTPDTFRDTIKAVKAQFKKWGVTTKLIGPEDVGAGSPFLVNREMSYIHAAELDPVAAADLDFFNVHGYADDKTTSAGGTTSSWAMLRDQTQRYDKRLWQTETSGDKPTWPGALHVALDIHEAVAYGNCNAWAYWQILDPGKPDVYALLSALDPTQKKYCVAKQYFKYIRPGAVRVRATGDTATFFASAFVNDQDKSLTVVLLNMGTNAEHVNLSLPTYPVVKTLNCWRTSATESFAAQPDVQNAGGMAEIDLPPESVVTLTGAGTGDAPTKPTVATNLLAQPLNEAVDLTWTAGWHADSYTVERATDEAGPFKSVASGITATHYRDGGLTDGQHYFYKVTGTNAQGVSPDTAAVAAMPMAVEALYTATPPKMDDKIDPQWAAAKWYTLDHVVRGSTSDGAAVSARFKMMWDATNLYALMETTAPGAAAAPDKPFAGDGWEIYVDSTGARGPIYGPGDFHFVLPFGRTQVNEVAHRQPTGGVCRSFKTPTGYIIEAQIPLATIGVGACNGNIFGLDLNVADHKSHPELFKLAWWSTVDFDWQNPSAFGAARLIGGSGALPTQAPAVTATPGNSSVTLNWKPVAGAIGYRIERAIAGAPLAVVANIPAGATPMTFLDLGVDEQETWQYAVIPYSAAGPGPQSPTVKVKPLAEAASPGSIMIHCGGGAIGRFAADEYFTGGSALDNYLGPINREVIDPAPTAVYQTERSGKFSYSIPGLKPGGQYLLRLHFCEDYWTAPGQRVFSVSANGKEILHDFDIFKEAHGQHTAVIGESTFTAGPDGKLDLTFAASKNAAMIQAIEIIPR